MSLQIFRKEVGPYISFLGKQKLPSTDLIIILIFNIFPIFMNFNVLFLLFVLNITKLDILCYTLFKPIEV